MKKIIVLFVSIFSVATLFGAELKPAAKLVKGTLENGVTYYIYPNDYPKGEAVYRLFLKSGSVLEQEDQRGLAHFMEHIAFSGTENFTQQSIITYLESKGAKFGKDINAHTSMNETVYKLQLPCSSDGFVDTSVMILADWAGRVVFDSAKIENERGVIFSEWLGKVGPKYDIQSAFLLELLNNSQFASRLTIGDTSVINNFTHDRLISYYRDWYNPRVMAVAVSGDVDPVKIEQMIKKHFSYLRSPFNKKIPSYTISDYKDVQFKSLSHESLNKIELNVIQLLDSPKPVRSEKDYPAYLQRVLLNKLTASRFSALSFDNPPYETGSLSYSNFMNTKGVLLGDVTLVPNKIDTGIVAFATELERIFRYGFVSIEIDKVKKSYRNEMRRKVESKSPKESMSFMDEIYSDFYVGNKLISIEDEYALMLKYIERIDSVDFVKQLHKLRKPEKTHYLMTSFDKVKDEMPSKERVLRIFDSLRTVNVTPYIKNLYIPEKLLNEEPVAGKIIEQQYIKEIDAYRLKLSNGSNIMFKRSILDKDRISLSGFRWGGLYALDSTDYVNGIFAGSVVPLSGAGEFSRDALSHFLTGSSVSMRFLIEKTRTGIIGGSDLKNMEAMFQLMYLKWTSPKLDAAIFQQTKDKTIESYLTANKTASSVFYKDLNKLMQRQNYTTRELSDTVINNEVDINKLLPVFNASFGNASEYEFLIVGDCSLDELKPYIEKYVAALPSGSVETDYKFKGAVMPQENIVFERALGDNPRASVALVFQKDTLDGELRSLNLKNDIAKDIIRTKLLNSLRTELNKVYSVGVSSSAIQIPSILARNSIGFECAVDDVDTLINRTFVELRNLVDNPSSFDRELADVKLNLTNRWKAENKKNIYWTSALRGVVYNKERDWKYVYDYENILNSITVEDISNVIKEGYFNSVFIKSVLLPKK